MRTFTTISRLGWAVSAALVFCLCGCGSNAESDATAHAKKGLARPKVAVDPSERAPSDMVAAVSTSKTGPPVQLKFELRGLPEVGQPVDVDVVLLPDSPALEHLYARFQGGEGLDLVSGGELPTIDKPVQGAPIRHTVRIVPKRDGIFTLSATVAVDSANDSLTRTFSIPVIAGDGLPELTAKSAVAEGPVTPGTASKTH